MTATTVRLPERAEWILCSGCEMPVYRERWSRNLGVCAECGRHEKLAAIERLQQLADPGSLSIMELDVDGGDPLAFVDTQPYPRRLAAARAQTGMNEAVMCAWAAIEGCPVVIAAMDFRFMGGSLGSAVGEMITLAAEVALAEHTPFLIVTASGGARMQEGALSLMQMAKTSAALAELDAAGILTISLITDPTFGGVAASFATSCDILVAEPGARLGFAGRRVIEQTIRQKLPDEFQTAEFLLERGFIDLITPRQQLRKVLGNLLRTAAPATDGTHTPGATEAPGGTEHGPCDGVVRDPGRVPEYDAWEQLRRARRLDRPTTLEYCSMVFDDFQQLHGDRLHGDSPAVVGGTARLCGRPVVVIGHQKGHSPAELTSRNFGMPGPDGYRKAARLMRLADKLGLPIVTLVDTPGAYPGMDAEAQGQAAAIAENLRLMATLRVPVVSVVIGEGGSGGALGIAVANRVFMLGQAVYSVISPEGCAAILWHDPAAAAQAAQALRIGPRDLLRLGVIDGVISEPDGGSGADPMGAADRLRTALASAIGELSQLSGADLAVHRRARFRQYGSVASADMQMKTIGDTTR